MHTRSGSAVPNIMRALSRTQLLCLVQSTFENSSLVTEQVLLDMASEKTSDDSLLQPKEQGSTQMLL